MGSFGEDGVESVFSFRFGRFVVRENGFVWQLPAAASWLELLHPVAVEALQLSLVAQHQRDAVARTGQKLEAYATHLFEQPG
jgi:hypothetical protein